MKKVISIFFLMFILCTNLLAYKDMTDIQARANDLNMEVSDYTFTMAITGALSGAIFGIFLWKTK